MIHLLAQEVVEAPKTYGSWPDYVVIIVYMLVILGFGSFFGRFAKSTRDFFFSGSKFSWWLIGMSMVATGVGSHSFVKYAQKGYEHGMSSGMSYMNDWFFIPLFMFGWLPIIYFSRVRSIPEYFQRRFGTVARFLAVFLILQYMVGYIGFNLFTLGTVAHQVLGIDIWVAIVAIAVVCGVYVTAGGQTAVIFTDLAQGFMLLIGGLLLFALGLDRLALDGAITDGIAALWTNLSLAERLPFAHFNEPQSFNFIGVFWQDGVAGSLMFLFISQGLMMRFLAAKSVNEGRKAILFNTLFILPISMIVVGNAGWLGNAMVDTGAVDAPEEARDIFVVVAELACGPGVFGFVLAALSAALMSTIDTYTNATAALFIYDVYQPYIKRGAPDRHYMRSARIASAVIAVVGLGIGLYFMTFGTDLYKIHGMFQSFVTPPIVVAVLLGAFWRRFTPAGAVAAMLGGMLCIWLSKVFPGVVAPFAHGVVPDGETGQYMYMTALYGLVCSAFIGVTVSLFTKPKTPEQIAGLWVGTMDFGMKRFKGGKPNHAVGKKVKANITITSDGTTGPTIALSFDEHQAMFPDSDAPAERKPAPFDEHGQPKPEYSIVRFSTDDLQRMKAEEGDLLYVSDARWWLGGLRSSHCRAGKPHDRNGVVMMTDEAFELASFVKGRPARVEKLL
ncbi:MAG: sodium:solute symporter family protein [Phycisphaerales bacterium]|nr:sodium:solute symporter family protein [Phycisphaerales bacterium]